MFKSTRKWAVTTKLVPRRYYLPQLEGRITKEQIQFLDKYWLSLDCIELTYEKGIPKLILYEVKTKNFIENRPAWWKPCITQSTVNIYREAIKLGMEVKFAFVDLHDNWEYEIRLEPFEVETCHVSVPREYDRESWHKNI